MAVTLLRRCLCTGFSSPLAPFNLLFGKTTQCSSPLCVSISSYLNCLQRLLKATGGPGKHPGSVCAPAAWRCCSRYSSKRRSRTSSHAPRPCKGPGLVCEGPHVREQGRGAACLPCIPLQWLCGSAAPSVTTDRARLALKAGECNQLQKTSPLFPTGSSKSGWQTKSKCGYI